LISEKDHDHDLFHMLHHHMIDKFVEAEIDNQNQNNLQRDQIIEKI